MAEEILEWALALIAVAACLFAWGALIDFLIVQWWKWWKARR